MRLLWEILDTLANIAALATLLAGIALVALGGGEIMERAVVSWNNIFG